MKYIPLVWAALTRRKLRLLLTFLSVTVAFLLFGIAIGFDASFKHLADQAHEDRIGVGARYVQMPMAMATRLERLPGVKAVSPQGFVCGYYRVPRNNTCVMMVAPNIKKIIPELPITDAQFHELDVHPDGAYYSRLLAKRWSLKAGDRFPIKAPAQPRADGAQVWIFQVLGIVDDIPAQFQEGFAIGSLKYFDQARVLASQGRIGFFRVLIDNPDKGAATAKLIDDMTANSAAPTLSMTDKFGASIGLSAAGIDVEFVTRSIAGAGLFMILFLTGNAIAQSVRERIPEFAMLKTIGYSDGGVMALVFAEAAVPCLAGAAAGMALARWGIALIPHLLPAFWSGLPPPLLSPSVLAQAFLSATLVAALSAILPASRLRRLDVAAALSGRS